MSSFWFGYLMAFVTIYGLGFTTWVVFVFIERPWKVNVDFLRRHGKRVPFKYRWYGAALICAMECVLWPVNLVRVIADAL